MISSPARPPAIHTLLKTIWPNQWSSEMCVRELTMNLRRYQELKKQKGKSQLCDRSVQLKLHGRPQSHVIMAISPQTNK